VQAETDAVAVLDAGTGIRLLGKHLGGAVRRVDVLLTHLHMDHIIGLGFFDALHRPGLEVHLWGPATTTLDLRGRLSRYLSPPLFPVRLRDLDCTLHLHNVPLGIFDIPGFNVGADLVCHPGPTVGYRLSDGRSSLAYLPDHEPALGVRRFPEEPRWTSGYSLADGVDVLLHDAQYTTDEYEQRAGWGHSTVDHAVTFARHVGAGRLVAFHHDPTHGDEVLDRLYDELAEPGVVPAREGQEFVVGTDTA
jgi:ribonuclease BN (tRNA processing enzyme)